MQTYTEIKTADEAVNLLSRLDRLPVTRTGKTSTILLILLWIGVAYCNGVIAPEILILKGLWSLNKQDIALLGISCTIGVVFGALLGGRLMDKYGRKKIAMYGLSYSLLMTVACGAIADVRWIIIMRFISGLGMGLLFPLPYVMISELFGGKSRGAVISIATGVLGVSYCVPNLAGAWIMNSFAPVIAWRLQFILAGFFIAIVVLLKKWLPESPRWLLQQGRIEEVRNLVNKLEDEAGFEHDSNLIVPGILQALQFSEQKQGGQLGRLFTMPLLSRSVMCFIVSAGCTVSVYMATTYFPMLLADKGLSPTNALALAAFIGILALLGALNVGRLSVAWGNKKFFLVYSLLAVLGYILMIQSMTIMLMGLVLVSVFGVGMGPFMQIYITEQFPTEMRGTAVGVVEASVRFFGGVIGIGLMPYLCAARGANGVFLTVALLTLICIVPVMIWGRETAGKSIEEASA